MARTVTSVDVLIPVLDRPHRVEPLLASLRASDSGEHDVTPHFLCSPGDAREIEAVKDSDAAYTIATWQPRNDFARKTNLGVSVTTGEFVLTAADDLQFESGWLEAALAVHAETGALVVGTNDLANPTVMRGDHATHSLVHRDYVRQGTIDEPGKLLCELYSHNSVDCEFVETAKARGVWAFAFDSHVRHLHPIFDRTVKRDATYNKGLRDASTDKRLLLARRHLWDSSAPRRGGIRVTRIR